MALTADRCRIIVVELWLGFCLLLTVQAGFAATRVPLDGGDRALLTDQQQLFLEAPPQRGEGWLGFAERLTGSIKMAPQVGAANGGSKRLLLGKRYRLPFALLSPDNQLRVVRGLFDDDRPVSEGWSHTVGGESLWFVAEWFTGRGDNYRLIREANGLGDDHLEPGQVLLVPARLLRPAFRAALPESSPYYLQYDEDRSGAHAVYRLKAGEALYSSVVVRFTGRIYSDDVNALAGDLARYNNIRDVTRIPVGYKVKIPLDLLLPEFLPAGNPRRREWEEGLIESAQFASPVVAARLRGVTVVLDAGHGGQDVGASVKGTWESLYVYDIMVRTKQLLEGSTAARVIATTSDGNGFDVQDRDRLPYTRSHKVLTEPAYPIDDSRVGVHLRWYLANSIYRRVRSEGVGADKVVFLSIHADSLHPSLRGAMAYIPSARLRGGEYGKSGAVYAARSEYRERPRVSFSRRELLKSEGQSRELALQLISSFGAARLEIHPDKPVRQQIVRRRRPWVPAVLRYNAVPTAVLLEVCNLANPEDRRLIQTREFRQQVAEAIAAGVLDYFGFDSRPGELIAAAAGG
jgi:N-acetylmuramoyl-L-alanine amidase